jgi:DNA-binding transcriptional regulator YiaG
MARRRARWEAGQVRALREQLALTQQQLADELGARQATISDWERGVYTPRGASAQLLRLIAERAGVPYEAGGDDAAGERRDDEG